MPYRDRARAEDALGHTEASVLARRCNQKCERNSLCLLLKERAAVNIAQRQIWRERVD